LVNDAYIYGTEGRIHIPSFIFAHNARLLVYGRDECVYAPEIVSNGYNYEAEEVMKCLGEGKTESGVMPLDESLVLMDTMDRIRAQWGFRYPQEANARDPDNSLSSLSL
jgi:hypothetical protein